MPGEEVQNGFHGKLLIWSHVSYSHLSLRLNKTKTSDGYMSLLSGKKINVMYRRCIELMFFEF